jgi:hypothetical protein
LSDLYFAYNGTSFGIRRSYGGLLQVHKFTVTTAGTGGTVDIVLNSVTFQITLTNAGGDTSFTAHEIEIGGSGGTAYTGWNVEHIGDDVFFIGGSVGARSGTYSITNVGEAALVVTSTSVKTGAALTTDFVAQADWNGRSPMIADLDPAMANLYEIQYTWFGTANIEYKVYNPTTGKFEVVHTLTYANEGTEYSLTSANMYIQRGVASLGSTTALSLESSGSFGATLGTFDINRSPRAAVAGSKAISGNTETAILTIGSRLHINGYANNSEVLLREISVAVDGNRPVIIKVVKNPTLSPSYSTTDYTEFAYYSETDSQVVYEGTVDTWTGGRLLAEKIVPKNGGSTLDLRLDNIFIAPGEFIVISALSTATNTVDVAVTAISDN